MTAIRAYRTVDTRQVEIPFTVARPVTAWQTRMLAYLSFPIEWEDCGPCTTVEFQDAKALVRAFDMDDPTAPWPPEAIKIKDGEIRYCAYTGKFLTAPQWRTPVGPRLEADVPRLTVGDPSREEVIAYVRALEAFIAEHFAEEEGEQEPQG